jgi:hypothetical protein
LSPAVAAPAPTPTTTDSDVVRDVLQRFRSAYDALDAASARAVWPGVNYGALARAFNDLESQTLTFQDCDVQFDGARAMAACRGTARYVAKVGSREPRVEPRSWKFTLAKSGSAWTIDSVRTER